MSDSGHAGPRTPLHVKILVAMALGSVIGILVNHGEQHISTEILAVLERDGEQVRFVEYAVTDSGEREQISSESFPDEATFARSYPALEDASLGTNNPEIRVTNATVRIIHSLKGVGVTWQRSHNGIPATTSFAASSADKLPPFWSRLATSNPLGLRDVVIIAASFVGDLFLALLKMVTVPLIITSLVTGVTSLGGQGRFGQLFSRTLIYYVTTSAIAVATGLLMVNLIQPGKGALLPGGGKAIQAAEQSLLEIVYGQTMRLIPTNPFASIAGGEFLSIISFAILFGVFINVVGGEHGKRLKEFFESAFEVMMRMTSWVISLAPIGVAAFMLYSTASQGVEIFLTLAWYMTAVFLALVFHAVITLPALVWFIGKRNPVNFFRDMSPALMTAFSTASSNAALPLTMNCVEQRAKISNGTSSFVLPLGATVNMDGTALYEVVAVMFIAQATPGIDLTIAEQVIVAFTALLASVGAAGIPHAGLVMMAIVLQAVGLPLESQGVIIAVDRVLDMCRTSVNVWSDSCGCAVVERLVPDTGVVEVSDAPLSEGSTL